MESESKMSPMLIGLAVGLVVGGLVGYFGAMALAPASTQETLQEEGNPLADVSENPLEGVKTNPFEGVKYNPFE